MLRRVILATAALAFTASVAYAQDAKLVEKGEKLFTSSKCTMCHSVADKGNKKTPLDGVGTKLTGDEIRQWLVNPAEMAAKAKSKTKPAHPKLAKEDVDALVAYLQTLKKK